MNESQPDFLSPRSPHFCARKNVDTEPALELLQKRASTKITFPNVWTNTCCSHQLHGMDRNEVDGPEDVRDGSVGGSRAAATRKLAHELGIPEEELSAMESEFKFLTRVHYWAADTVTHGEKRWAKYKCEMI